MLKCDPVLAVGHPEMKWYLCKTKALCFLGKIFLVKKEEHFENIWKKYLKKDRDSKPLRGEEYRLIILIFWHNMPGIIFLHRQLTGFYF